MSEPSLWLVAGLGNPHPQHRNNRHNVGFLFLDHLLPSSTTWEYKLGGFYVEQDGVVFLKPSLFMNSSGEVVKNFMSFFGVSPQRVCVVYDDVYLPLGSWRFRNKGSSGGHNGIADIIRRLGTEQIKRFRIGVGPKPPHVSLQNFVLADLSLREKEVLSYVFPALSSSFFSLLKGL